MEEIILAEYFGNSIHHHQIYSELKIVEAARNGSVRAQWYSWATCCNAENEIANNNTQELNAMSRYILEISFSCQRDNIKIETYFPWFQKEEKIREEHERMIHSYILHLIIKAIRKGHSCSRDDAVYRLVQLALDETSYERRSGKTKFFERFNTISKLEKELKFYKQNYEKWSFLLELFVDNRFPHPFKFQPPGQYDYHTDVSALFESMLTNPKVSDHNLQ